MLVDRAVITQTPDVKNGGGQALIRKVDLTEEMEETVAILYFLLIPICAP